MNNDYWYDDHMQQHFSEVDNRKQGKRSVPVFVFVICLLVTALIGGGAGAALVYGLNHSSAQEQEMNQTGAQAQIQAPAPASSTPALNEANNTIVPVVTNGSGYTKTQIVDIAAPTIVGIDVEVEGGVNWFGQSTMQTGSGSGVVVTPDGYIVTNDHVVAGAMKIKVYLYDDTEYDAVLIGTDEKTDLAVIKIEANGLAAAVLGDSDQIKVGNDVIAIGNPLGELRGTATSGMVSALSRTINIEGQEMTLLQTDAAINPGNSGGGLFNDHGELIGVINAKVASSTTEGLGFAIPVNDVKTVVTDLMDLGYVSGRAYLGVYTQNVAVTTSSNVDGREDNSYRWDQFFGFGGNEYSGRPNQETRVQVVQIVLGSAAERAGIQAGDLILQVGPTEVKNQMELSKAIGEYLAGDQVIMKIQRDGAEMDVTVTFGELVPEG
ncbi:trypsin-like peptidase domain-containing protein [Christensenellaceae bacterium OttesenSCG-928-M15]|nr:trypsin-like peptidase domain-containing protein [Christensenellaceae bacterium OttesenSCG-928-M15]